MIGPIVAVFLWTILLPYLNSLTSNQMSERLSDVSSTGRFDMLVGDLTVFLENPFLGVGPGGSKTMHEEVFYYAASHTEQTRMLAEHGILGAFSLILLLGTIIFRCFDPRQSKSASYLKLSLAAWGLFYMVHAAFRSALPGLMIAFATSQPDRRTDE